MLAIAVILVGLAGFLAIPVYLIHFAWTTRRDMLLPTACGRSGRWARRAAGVSVQRAG
jgi:hypothetical protein